MVFRRTVLTSKVIYMSRNKILICLITVLMVLTCCMCWAYSASVETLPFSVCVDSGESTEELDVWKGEGGIYYVFLPSYADLTRTRLVLSEANASIQIGQVQLTDGLDCGVFELNQQYACTYHHRGKTHNNSIIFVKSDGIPAVYISTLSESMEYIHAEKDNQESGAIRIYTDMGMQCYEGMIESISGRGNTSWDQYEKKPYNIRLEVAADLLGMGSAQNWVLLANAADVSNMRNKIVYDFAKKLGLAYSPDSRWIDLYLNGCYAGLYLLCEKNEVHSERVDIEQEGSVLVSQELESRLVQQKRSFVTTENKQIFRIHYPITVTEQSISKIEQVLQSVENAILVEDNINYAWQNVIDLDSWTKKYLIEELFGNIDASYLSQYFYIDGNINNGKLYAGPVWDYDLAIGNKERWQLSSPNVLLANRLLVRDGVETPWFHSLCKKTIFWHSVKTSFEMTVIPQMQSLLNFQIQEYAALISKAVEMDQIRWGNPTYNFEAEVKYIQNYLKSRVEFLQRIWLEGKQYHVICAKSHEYQNYGYFAVESGSCFADLPCLENTQTETFVGWYYADIQELFDVEAPINEDITIYAKYESSDSQYGNRIIKLLPLGVIAVAFLLVMVIEIKRIKNR